jgi:hypothetical protein
MLLDQGDDAKKGDEKEHVTLAAWRRGDGQDLSSGAILRVPDENTPYCHMKFRRCVRIIYLGRIRFLMMARFTPSISMDRATTIRSALTRLRRSGE